MARVKLDNYVVPDAPRLGLRGWLRWMWRQVTSMRVALILLVFMALASIPGSVLPQRPREPGKVIQFLDANGWWGTVLDTLGFLDVYGSAWFTAIYVLLFASLIGCIVPRAIAHFRALREPVARAPQRLDRYDTAARGETADDPATAVGRASDALRPRAGIVGSITGYRVRVDEREDGTLAFAAEKGHVRELGNLLFHAALVGVLIAIAAGTLLTFRGQAIIVEGRAFTNAVAAYDTFSAGRLFSPDDLEPWTLALDELSATFSDTGRAEDFTAYVTLTEPGEEPLATDIRVNKPLVVDGASIYLQGNGYAPEMTFTDADGNVAFAGPVVFLPQDAAYTSTGVIKVPDVTSGEQVGFKATLYPSAVGQGVQWASIHPDPANPVIVVQAYTGDLGLDSGIPQNVYRLDESQLSPVRDENGDVWLAAVTPGESVDLPGGLGSLSFDGLPRFAAFDLRSDPSLPWLLTFAVLSLTGLAVSLFGARRRIWLLVARDGETTVVTGAALASAHDTAAQRELERAVAAASGRAEEEN